MLWLSIETIIRPNKKNKMRRKYKYLMKMPCHIKKNLGFKLQIL